MLHAKFLGRRALEGTSGMALQCGVARTDMTRSPFMSPAVDGGVNEQCRCERRKHDGHPAGEGR
jgi:hypothetical protein